MPQPKDTAAEKKPTTGPGNWSEISLLSLRTRKRGGSPSPRSCRRGPETQVLNVKGPSTSAKIQKVQQPQPTSPLSLSLRDQDHKASSMETRAREVLSTGVPQAP